MAADAASGFELIVCLGFGLAAVIVGGLRALLVAIVIVGAYSLAHAAELPRYTYTDQAGHRWCGTVQAFDTGADARSWAWLVSTEGPPFAILHVPAIDLIEGCSR
ncbi:MAG: hypothetical protein ABI433_07245 [Burkholderiaceae bacterium]